MGPAVNRSWERPHPGSCPLGGAERPGQGPVSLLTPSYAMRARAPHGICLPCAPVTWLGSGVTTCPSPAGGGQGEALGPHGATVDSGSRGAYFQRAWVRPQVQTTIGLALGWTGPHLAFPGVRGRPHCWGGGAAPLSPPLRMGPENRWVFLPFLWTWGGRVGTYRFDAELRCL